LSHRFRNGGLEVEDSVEEDGPTKYAFIKYNDEYRNGHQRKIQIDQIFTGTNFQET
jgi:hypothetical protein